MGVTKSCTWLSDWTETTEDREEQGDPGARESSGKHFSNSPGEKWTMSVELLYEKWLDMESMGVDSSGIEKEESQWREGSDF